MEAFYVDELDQCGLQVDQDPVEEFLNCQDIESLLEIENELMSTESLTQQVSTEVAHQEELLIDENNCVTDLLLMGAEALEARNWLGASTVISRLFEVLNFHESEEHNNTFSRLALLFTKGLHHKLRTSDPHNLLVHDGEEESTVLTQGNTMTAFQMLQELTPYVKFAHFTANQAILEATIGDQEVHVIDFDIMDGIQWPPLMIDLSLRENASLKITATISPGTNQKERTNIAHQTGRRLKEFADSINLPFTFSHFVLSKEEDFNIIMDQNGYFHSKVIANCIINQFYMPEKSWSQVGVFLNGIKKLIPKILVLVEEEFSSFSIKNTPKPFVELFCEALHHYNAIDESLVSSFVNEYKMGIRVVENQLLGVKIRSCLRQMGSWEVENEILKDLKRVRLSFGNVCQAKFLVGLFKGGYWVQNEHCRLALCWKSKPLTVVSVWAPTPITCQE